MTEHASLLTGLVLVLTARPAAAQSCTTAQDCPPERNCVQGQCEPAPPPASTPPPDSTPPPGPELSMRERPAHLEFSVNVSGIFVPPGTGAFFPNVTLGVRSRVYDLRLVAGYLHTQDRSTAGDGVPIGIDPRVWFGAYGVGFTLAALPMSFTALRSSGWSGFSLGIAALAMPVAFQFGTGRLRFETSLRLGAYFFPDRNTANTSFFALVSVGLVFG